MTTVLRALPDLVRLVGRLAADPSLPRAVKVMMVAAALYLLSPVDVVPDLIPVAGVLDDLLVAAILVDGLLTYVDRDLLLRYWPGTPDSLDRVAAVARFMTAWVPRRLKARIFAPR